MTTPTNPTPQALDTNLKPSPNGHIKLHVDERGEINKLSQARIDGVPVKVFEATTQLPTPAELGAAPESLTGRVESLEKSGSAIGVHPAGNNLVGWSYDPIHILNGSTITSGNLYVVKVPVGASGPLRRVLMGVYAAGATFTAAGVAVYNEAGTLLDKADAVTAFGGTGIREIALPAAVSVAPGIYQVAFFCVATTMPSVGRSSSTSAGQWGNLGLTSAAARFATAGTASDLATLPAILPAKTGIQQTFFAGLAA